MKNPEEVFARGLNTIRNIAALKNGSVEVSDILRAFEGTELSDGQIRMIYDYLEEENILLADYVPREEDGISMNVLAEEAWGGPDSEADQKLFDFYSEDLASIAPLSSRETAALAEDLLKGGKIRDKAAERLAEGNLRWVVQIARDYSGRGVALADLIQEGNLALWIGIREYTGEQPLDDVLEKSIRETMKAVLKEQGVYLKTEEKMAGMANRILDAVKEMEEETGEAVTAAEISLKLGIPESRVEEVMRESAKAMRNVEH